MYLSAFATKPSSDDTTGRNLQQLLQRTSDSVSAGTPGPRRPGSACAGSLRRGRLCGPGPLGRRGRALCAAGPAGAPAVASRPPPPCLGPGSFSAGGAGSLSGRLQRPPGAGSPSPSRDAPDAPSLPSARPCVAQGRLSPPPALEALRNLVGTPVVQVSAAAASKQMLRLCSLQGVESVCGSDAARARLLGARAAAWPGGRPLRAARQAAAQAPPVGLRLQPPPSGSRAPLPATASRLCRFCRSVSRESAGSERVAPRSASRVCGAAGPPRAAPQCRS